MTASQIEASTRSLAASMSKLGPAPPSGARSPRRRGTSRSSATAAHEAPLTACARTLVRRPAP